MPQKLINQHKNNKGDRNIDMERESEIDIERRNAKNDDFCEDNST